ncbi:MAG: hypothetical protein NTZ67_01265 [Gammaproteobacteria bacterium]|nr:hypothetical protein [Gammaproteobacteria bacterium]
MELSIAEPTIDEPTIDKLTIFELLRRKRRDNDNIIKIEVILERFDSNPDTLKQIHNSVGYEKHTPIEDAANFGMYDVVTEIANKHRTDNEDSYHYTQALAIALEEKKSSEKMSAQRKVELAESLMFLDAAIDMLRKSGAKEMITKKNKLDYLIKKLNSKTTELEILLNAKGTASGKKELLQAKLNALTAAQNFLCNEINRETFYMHLVPENAWRKGIRSRKTESLVMEVIHHVDRKIKATPLNNSKEKNPATEQMATTPENKNKKIQKLIKEIDARIATLKSRQQNTHTFKKYTLWEDKIAALEATKGALSATNRNPSESTLFDKLSKDKDNKWDASFFASTTKKLVKEAEKILKEEGTVNDKNIKPNQ